MLPFENKKRPQNVLASNEKGGEGEDGGAGAQDAEERMMEQQRDEYGRRGIHLTFYEKGTSTPHFINLDEDPFRSHRFMYLLEKVRPCCGTGGGAFCLEAENAEYGKRGCGLRAACVCLCVFVCGYYSNAELQV